MEYIDIDCHLITISEDVGSCFNFNDMTKLNSEKTLAARTYLRNKA